MNGLEILFLIFLNLLLKTLIGVFQIICSHQRLLNLLLKLFFLPLMPQLHLYDFIFQLVLLVHQLLLERRNDIFFFNNFVLKVPSFLLLELKLIFDISILGLYLSQVLLPLLRDLSVPLHLTLVLRQQQIEFMYLIILLSHSLLPEPSGIQILFPVHHPFHLQILTLTPSSSFLRTLFVWSVLLLLQILLNQAGQHSLRVRGLPLVRLPSLIVNVISH